MADNHPLYSEPSNPHPLSDDPPQQEKPKGVAIRVPLNAKFPILTYTLLVLNVGIFVLRYIMPELSNDILFAGYIDPDLVLRNRELYRLVTGMFLHFDEAHILFNGIALYYVGGHVERLFGHARFALIYILGGLGGSILPLLFNSGGLGASGAVFAIWGAEMIFLYQHQQLFGVAGRARLKNSLVLMLVNFIAGFSANALATVADSPVRVGNAAHFGGLFGGAILAVMIAPLYLIRRKEATKDDPAEAEIIQGKNLKDDWQLVIYYCIGLLSILLIATLLYT